MARADGLHRREAAIEGRETAVAQAEAVEQHRCSTLDSSGRKTATAAAAAGKSRARDSVTEGELAQREAQVRHRSTLLHEREAFMRKREAELLLANERAALQTGGRLTSN